MGGFDSNIVVAVVTAVVGISASVGVVLQLRLSNKHFLFDRRLSAYTTLQSLVSTFRHSMFLLRGSETMAFNGFGAKIVFGMMCNTPVWVDATGGDVLHAGGEMQTRFLLKCDELRNFAESLSFLFSVRHIAEMSEFVNLYVSVVSTLRGCCIGVEACVEMNKELCGFGDSGVSVPDKLDGFLKHEKYFENVERMETIVNSGIVDKVLKAMSSDLRLGRK